MMHPLPLPLPLPLTSAEGALQTEPNERNERLAFYCTLDLYRTSLPPCLANFGKVGYEGTISHR